MRRTGSWLVGAWVRISDGKPEPSWSLIGMVLRHAEPWPDVGFFEPGNCVILLHDLDDRFAYRLLSGMSFTYRFEVPGLVVEWAAFAEGLHETFGEGRRIRIEFFGPPRIISADARWERLTRFYGSDVNAASLAGGELTNGR